MIAFRDATEADLGAVVDLLADDELGHGRESPGLPLDPAYGAGFRSMAARGGCIILALDGDAIVGCLQLDLLPGVAQRGMIRAQIEGVRIARASRGQGIGKELVLEAVRRAREAGAVGVQLTSNLARVDARRFYERLGFTHSHAGMKAAVASFE